MAFVEAAPSIGPAPSSDDLGRPTSAQSTNPGLSISEIFAAMSRRKRWVIGMCALTLLLGTLLMLMFPMLYKATAQLMVDPRGLQVLANELTPRGQTTEVNATIVETQARILASDVVLRGVVEDQHLDRDPEFNGVPDTFFGQIKLEVKNWLGQSSGYDAATEALVNLRQRTRVQSTPGTYVVDINVSTSDPHKSARIAQAVSQAYVSSEAHLRMMAGRRTSDSLSSRLDDLRGRVSHAEEAVERFKRDNNIVGANGRLVSEQQLSELSGQLVAARALTGEIRARHEQTERLLRSGAVPDSSLEAAQSAVITQLRARYAEAKQAEDDMAANYGPRHPSLVSLQSQTRSLRQQITQELQRVAAGARNNLDRAQAAEDALSRRLEAVSRDSGVVNEKLVQLRELEREAQASRTVYESFLNRAREIRAQLEVDTTNTTVISPALPPVKPSGVPPLLILGFAGALGLTLGGLTALGRDRLDGRVHTARQLTALTGLPVLGLLPRFRAKSRRKNALVSLADVSMDQMVTDSPNAHSRAVFRVLDRISEARTGRPPVVVMVTATEDRVRKSCVALNLALAASQRGQRVLLIDGDPDGPISAAIGKLSVKGLDDVLHSRASFGEAGRVLNGTNVVLLTNRPGSESTARVPTTFEREFAKWTADFAVVVIDGGLVNHDANVRRFAEVATGIVLVIQAETTKFAALNDARATLGSQSSKVAGAVFLTDHAG